MKYIILSLFLCSCMTTRKINKPEEKVYFEEVGHVKFFDSEMRVWKIDGCFIAGINRQVRSNSELTDPINNQSFISNCPK